MLPDTLTTIPGDGWLMEPKWDGARMLVVVEDAVRIHGRRGIDYTRKLGLQAEALASLPADTVLDSELVCLRMGADGSVSDDWSGAQSIVSSGQTTRAQQETVQLVVFDVLSYDGIDCRTLTLVERRAFLERVFEEHDFGWKIRERRALSADCAALIGRVVEVKTYAGVNQRSPVFLRWREDKAAEDCRAE
jgi:ATP-dependent DNA ligase